MSTKRLELGSFSSLLRRLKEGLPIWWAEKVAAHEKAHADEYGGRVTFGVIVREAFGQERITGAFVRPVISGEDTKSREFFIRLKKMAVAPLVKLGDALSKADKKVKSYAEMMIRWFDSLGNDPRDENRIDRRGGWGMQPVGFTA